MEIDHPLAFPTGLPRRILGSRRSRDLTTKVSEHTATTLDSSRRVLDLNVLGTSLRLETNSHLETNLRLEANLLSETSLRLGTSHRLALGVYQREKRTPLMLSTGALDLRVMETEAPHSTKAIALREMDSAILPALSTEVRALHAMEKETHPEEATGHLIVTASSMTTSPSPFRIPAPQANGCMVSTPSWQRCAATHASSTN
jgi:hypothetical protein